MTSNKSSVNQKWAKPRKKTTTPLQTHIHARDHKSYISSSANSSAMPKISIKSSLQRCWWLLVTGSPRSRAWQWSFMARDLIQDFCSSANTVAMGTKEQLPYNWINIRLLLQHSALCWGLVLIPAPAPSTCPWICMQAVINMHSVSNVCGAAYMVDKELYADCPGRASPYTSRPWITFSAARPPRLRATADASAWSEVWQRHLVDHSLLLRWMCSTSRKRSCGNSIKDAHLKTNIYVYVKTWIPAADPSVELDLYIFVYMWVECGHIVFQEKETKRPWTCRIHISSKMIPLVLLVSGNAQELTSVSLFGHCEWPGC